MADNTECETCKKKVCPEECFNRHEGSAIALKKLGCSLGQDLHIVGP